MNIDSTVIIKSAIESRLRLLSVKQLPEIYELQLFIHDSIVKVDNEGNTVLNEFFKNSFPDSVQRLTLYAQLSKSKTEPIDENLLNTIRRIISTWILKDLYLPDWCFTKLQINRILNDWTYLETIDIRRNEGRYDKNSKTEVQVKIEDPSLFKNLKRLYLVSIELNEKEVKGIVDTICNSDLLKQLEVINLSHNAVFYDYKQELKNAGYEKSYY